MWKIINIKLIAENDKKIGSYGVTTSRVSVCKHDLLAAEEESVLCSTPNFLNAFSLLNASVKTMKIVHVLCKTSRLAEWSQDLTVDINAQICVDHPLAH